MAIQYSTQHRNDNMADITTDLGATAYLLIYTGSPPANCGTAASGTLLASLPCSNPFAGSPSGGVLSASAITSEAAGASGTAGYWRLCTSSAGTTVVAQGTCGTSGADLNFAGGTAFTSGQTIAVTSFQVTATGS
jgi:hypothetical protein